MRFHFRCWISVLLLAVLCGRSTIAVAQASPPSSTRKTEAKAKTKRKPVVKKARRRATPRVRRMRQAFVASSTLKPMARQLLQERALAAYAGVEAYARRHPKDDAGALAWLVVGYARGLDRDFSRAIDALNRAKPRAGDLGDYVNYYLSDAYFQTGRIAEALLILSNFDTNYPDSLLRRDARVLYANALLSDGRPREAAALLENDRQPTRADLELALGRAYAAMGQVA